MTKSLHVGTRAEGDKDDVGAETLRRSDTPIIRVSEASDDGETVTAAITQTLTRCLVPPSDSINSSVYIHSQQPGNSKVSLVLKKIFVTFLQSNTIKGF